MNLCSFSKNNADVTILVNSCDLYEDAWYPFFKLLKIQWPDCPYDIVLNTETIAYDCDFLNVKTICGGKNSTWSQRILKCLEAIDTDFVLFFLEDQFLQSAVNVEYFNKTVDYMKDNTDVGVIFVRHTGKQVTEYDEPYISRFDLTDKFPIVGLAALYRKSYFKKLLRKHENPWEFEKYASIRCRRYSEKVLQYSKQFPRMFEFYDEIYMGYGITQRKWLPKNKELFDKFEIECNFEKLGWLDIDNLTRDKGSISNNKVSEYNTRAKLYNMKKSLVRLPKSINSMFRKLRSLF